MPQMRIVIFLVLFSCNLHFLHARTLSDEDKKDLLELAEVLDGLSDDDVKRIIGGQKLQEKDHPWLVSLQGTIKTSFFSSKKLYCGASLIRPRWIMTAAHCFVHKDLGEKAMTPEYWTARLGEIELESGFFDSIGNFIGGLVGYDKWRTWEIHGEKIIVHPNYNPDSYWLNDIALMKLKSAVPATEVRVGAVTLQTSRDFPTGGMTCTAIGWGCNKAGGRVSDYAMKVDLEIKTDEQCNKAWGVSTDTRICAGDFNKNKGICSGDSGGPLMCKKGDTWYQVGISSFASAKSPGDFPGVFTRVSAFDKWIRDNAV